jgi:hypothetical protein
MTETNGGTAAPIPEEFKLLHLYWQASNYLSVGQVSSSISYSNQTDEQRDVHSSTFVHSASRE